MSNEEFLLAGWDENDPCFLVRREGQQWTVKTGTVVLDSGAYMVREESWRDLDVQEVRLRHQGASMSTEILLKDGSSLFIDVLEGCRFTDSSGLKIVLHEVLHTWERRRR